MTASNPFKVVIPARYHSTRLPGKPLIKLAGKEMILRVYDKACRSDADQVVIATDDERIYNLAISAGADVCMTATDHKTGTDRLSEVVNKYAWPADTIVVNVQGDEPLMPVSCINLVAENLHKHKIAVMATLATRIQNSSEYTDPNVVKVVFDRNGLAMLFSRSPIPHYREKDFDATFASYRHLGIYAYRAAYLLQYSDLSECGIEFAEKLEQLRVLNNGDRIHVDLARELPGPGVDTPEQLAEVELLVQRELEKSGQ